jgi:WD40 repeat protein
VVWDAGDGHEVMTLPVPGDNARSVVSTDGTRLVTAVYSNIAQLWEIGTGRHVADLRTYESDSSSGSPEISLSPDGRLLMARGDGVAVWDLATGRQLARWTASAGAFSNDSRLVATVNISRNDRVAHVWDANSGREVSSVQGHIGRIEVATFSQDDGRLVTIGSEGKTTLTGGECSVRLWEPTTGRVVGQLRDAEGGIVFAVGIAGGRWLITESEGEGGNRLRVHPWEQFAPIDDVLASAHSLVARELDGYERARFLHE